MTQTHQDKINLLDQDQHGGEPKILSRRGFISTTALTGLSALSATNTWRASLATEHPPNILFILVDDLRPELGCYGNPIVKTPHLDNLASGGITFQRNYCQVALCAPSRTSLLTGLRPDTSRIWWIGPHFRDSVPDVVTLPQLFKQNGYHTQAFGKVFHSHNLDDPASWSAPLFTPAVAPYGPEEMTLFFKEQKRLGAMKELGVETDPQTGLPLFLIEPGISWEAPHVEDNYFWDGQVADRVISTMEEKRKGPFFLCAGFSKPHLPFVAPAKYFDLYPIESIIPPSVTEPPEGAPAIEFTQLNEWIRYRDIRRHGVLTPEKTRDLIRAYYAATSYADAQVGRLLGALERLGLAGNTIVVVWGDNGYKLGEYGFWGKESNFELDTRVPLIIRAPGHNGGGLKCMAVTESLGLYPTLCDLCGISKPEHLEGDSLVPLLDDPEHPWKDMAISQFFRLGLMGYTLRTQRYRYTEWIPFNPTSPPPPGNLPEAVAWELYDHESPLKEQLNLAEHTEYSRVRQELGQLLRGEGDKKFNTPER